MEKQKINSKTNNVIKERLLKIKIDQITKLDMSFKKCTQDGSK